MIDLLTDRRPTVWGIIIGLLVVIIALMAVERALADRGRGDAAPLRPGRSGRRS